MQNTLRSFGNRIADNQIWAGQKELGAILTGYCRPHVKTIAVLMSRRMSELGMTQRMLAEKMNCTQQYISKMLKGQKNMSLETICKIENTLGIEIIKGLNENEQ